MSYFMETMDNLLHQTAFFNLTVGNFIMILVACVFLYLAIAKGFEPLLLVPIAFGMLLVNIYPDIFAEPEMMSNGVGGLFHYFYTLDEWSILPSLIFLGVGAMTDFGPLIANPISFLLGAAAQFGIFGAYFLAILLGFNDKAAAAVSIIGGADGPTSIFIAGHSKKQPLKIRIKNSIYRYKRKKVEKTIVANPHSLSETVQYAKDKYELTETAPADREYIEQIKCLKESLILQYEPELLGEMKDIPVPDFSNEASVKEYLGKIKTRSEMIAEMPDSIIPMDFHLYKIRIDDDFLEMEIDYTWNIFRMSYSGNKAVMKKFKKISRDLYSYYGVTEKDIKNKTKRYSSLVTNLSS